MRTWIGGVAMAGLMVLMLGGCESDTSSKGFSSVTITGEEEQTVQGNLCAVRGHATNTGNRRARVRVTYEGKSGGNVIATSVAEFEVAPFSNFDFASWPSLALMTMFEYVATFAVEGVPDSRPVDVLNVAQEGRFAIENVSVSPSGSVAVGWKLYAAPAITEGAGVPEIVGAPFAPGGVPCG